MEVKSTFVRFVRIVSKGCYAAFGARSHVGFVFHCRVYIAFGNVLIACNKVCDVLKHGNGIYGAQRSTCIVSYNVFQPRKTTALFSLSKVASTYIAGLSKSRVSRQPSGRGVVRTS